MSENILSVQNLHTSFHTDKGEVKAVNGVTFNLEKGSGCQRIPDLLQNKLPVFLQADKDAENRDCQL